MTDIEKIKGIIKFVKKDKKGVQFEDGNWYSNKFFKGEVNAKRGDEVEVEVAINGQYKNLVSLKVLKESAQPVSAGSTGGVDHRIEVDAGNCLQRATELLIAGKYKDLSVATLEVCVAFRSAKKELAREPEPMDQKIEETTY